MTKRRGKFRTRRTVVHSRKMVAGFTLIEMLVSMAVLVVTLTVVGVVFSVTTKTATTAAAMAEVQAWVREWERQVTQDLKFVDPSSSVLVLVGRTQAAALTEDDLQARKFLRYLVGDPGAVPSGYDPVFDTRVDPQYSNPRADLMMLYTMRATASQAPPSTLGRNNSPNPYLAGARFAPVQIVYGHAARGEVDMSTTPAVFSSNLTHIEQILGGGTDPDKHSVIPANRWHLARRATIIEPETAFNSRKRSFSSSEFTRITRCLADGNNAGDVARLNWQLYLATFGPGNSRTGYLLQFVRMQPYVFDPAVGARVSGTRIDEAIYDVLYPRATKSVHHVATILDEPPLELRSNLGLHMLPSCAWFQVEFLMPEDPRNSLDYYNPDPSQPLGTSFSNRYDTPRWTEVGDNETYLFLPDTAENRRVIASSDEIFQRLADFALTNPLNPPPSPVESRRIRLWPYAIRLTVRVYDSRNRLAEPIVRSIVHRFE